MPDAYFQSFLTAGLFVLIIAVGLLTWCGWRYVDREKKMELMSLDGVGHELRVNLQRLLTELSQLANGTLKGPSDLLPLVHPQLDAVITRPGEADRRALTVIRSAYNELGARKLDIRSAIIQGTDPTEAVNDAANALIDSIGTLYLWEIHKGKPPAEARSTRSWHVRDWMKLHDFRADALPGLHLRDQVVERLRTYGMTLTPRPLTYTASEYFAKQYDRKADPNAPFWKRKPKPVVEEADMAEPEQLAEAGLEDPAVEPETEAEVPAPMTDVEETVVTEAPVAASDDLSVIPERT